MEARAVRLFIAERFSASEVADVLGCGLSRAAVISKMRRLGYRKRETSAVCGLDVLRQAHRSPRAQHNPQPGSAVERRLPPARPPQPLPPLREIGPTGHPVTLALLHDGACRWPIDDPGAGLMHRLLFCAGPATRGSYCAAHGALALDRSLPGADSPAAHGP